MKESLEPKWWEWKLRREPVCHGALTAQSQMRRHEFAPKGKPTAQWAAPLAFPHGAITAHGAKANRGDA
jgi:hypothetical protein